jgi:hypothetical protein
MCETLKYVSDEVFPTQHIFDEATRIAFEAEYSALREEILVRCDQIPENQLRYIAARLDAAKPLAKELLLEEFADSKSSRINIKRRSSLLNLDAPLSRPSHPVMNQSSW